LMTLQFDEIAGQVVTEWAEANVVEPTIRESRLSNYFVRLWAERKSYET